MNKKDLELFGLSEGATKEQITAAYETLRAKYLEERFMDGEVGNNAAAMLTRIESAYNELLSEINENASSFDGSDSFTRVEDLIRAGDLAEAQRVLDSFNERGGRWHYLQSVVFYRKNWINESKKQLEIAIQLEPNNDKYKETYKKLNDKLNYDSQQAAGANQTVYQGQTMNAGDDNQMGGSFCANCIECCYINMCINCLCNACCH
ncbi:MAG: phage protease [Clostridia bacterium]|nr:phage protease [Clostridia bacterium]